MERVVLVVDDEKPILDILKFNLEKEGIPCFGCFRLNSVGYYVAENGRL